MNGADTNLVQHEFGVNISFVGSITLSLEDAVLEWALKQAAQRNSNLSRMVGEMLAGRVRQTDAYAQAMHEALKFEPIPFEGSYLNREMIADRRPTFEGSTHSIVQS